MAVLFKSGSGARIATYLIACAVLIACLMTIMPRSVSASSGLVIVDGTVTDSAGRPIAGASVTVVMMNGTTPVDTQTTTTDSAGFYTLTVSSGFANRGPGFTINSTATFNSVQIHDTTTIPDEDFPRVTINLQFLFEIPQFGSILGFAATAGLVGVVAVVFLAKKSK